MRFDFLIIKISIRIFKKKKVLTLNGARGIWPQNREIVKIQRVNGKILAKSHATSALASARSDELMAAAKETRFGHGSWHGSYN